VTTHEAAVRSSPLTETTTALLALLGLIDIALLAVLGSADAPPLAVSLGVAALGLITLIALIPAHRGSRAALRTIVVARVISALLAIPAFFLKAPAWVMTAEGLLIAGTVLALLLLRRGSGRTSPIR
jgi:hypothetical protein